MRDHHTTSLGTRGALLGAALVASTLALAPPASAAPETADFNLQTTIEIPAGGVGRPAAPYPAPITVAGVQGTITDVDIVLRDLTHTKPDEIGVLLVGPDGTNGVMMSAIGGNTPVNGIDVTIDEDAQTFLPNAAPLTQGSFKPNSFGTTDFPAPAPAPAAIDQTGSLDSFNGKDPNGTWSLFVVDVVGGDSGSMTGWTLRLTTDTAPPPPPGAGTACPSDKVPEDGFTDVPTGPPPAGNVHESAIDCVVAYGLATGGPGGAPPTTYGPGLDVTRGQMASFIARLIEATGTQLPAAPPDAFTDDNGTTHEPRINQLAAAGVIGGNGENGTSYRPNDPMRRDEMADFIDNAHGLITGTPYSAQEAPDAFPDDDGNPHEAAINGLAAASIVTGTVEGLYAPAASVRRDSMASFLAREVIALVGDGEMANKFP